MCHLGGVICISEVIDISPCGLFFLIYFFYFLNFKIFNSYMHSLAHFLIGSFIFLELSCRICLYIFEISLSVASFAIIFSHSEGCLFTLLIISCAAQKAFKFNQVPLVYFCFYFHYSRRWVIEDRSSFDLCHQVFCLCFPLRFL